MSRISERFQALKTKGETGLVTYITAGDPDLEQTAGIMKRLDKAGASIRATRWLSEARLVVGDLKVMALFIAPVEKTPGDGLNAGCLRLDDGVRVPVDAAMTLEGQPVRE